MYLPWVPICILIQKRAVNSPKVLWFLWKWQVSVLFLHQEIRLWVTAVTGARDGDGVQEPRPSWGVRTPLPCWPSSGQAAAAHWGLFWLSKGAGTSARGSFSSLWLQTSRAGSCCGAAVGLLPPPQPLPWHPCTGVGRDDNGPESYRNQANTEACCLLFTRLWISILWHRKSAGRKTLFLLATTRCLSQAALARALQRGKDHGWCWAEQRGDGHIFSMELCGKSDLSLLFYHILWASYLIQVKSKLLNRTVTQHAYQINEVWV